MSRSPAKNAATRRREWAKNLATMLMSIVVTLLLLEGAVRIFAPQELVASELFLSSQPGANPMQARSARRALQPNVRCRHRSDEFDVAVRINSRGLRDVEHSLAKPPGVRRVLVLGDSFTFGYGVEENQRFSNLLARQLGAGWEFINSGVPTWGTADELSYLRDEGLKYHPDLVVLFFYRNDVTIISSARFFGSTARDNWSAPLAKSRRENAMRSRSRAILPTRISSLFRAMKA